MLKLKLNLILLFLVLLISGFISGCGGSSDSDSEQTTAISGYLMAGPVSGAIVTAYKLNADGTPGDEIGVSSATGTDGFYSIPNPDYKGPVLIKATDISEATYIDEATGTKDTPTTLTVELTATAYIDSLTATISITPITHIAAQLITTNTKTEIDTKNQLVAT